MQKQEENLVFRMTEQLRGHFQPNEIMRIIICMVFLKWALSQEALNDYRAILVEVEEDKDLIADLRNFVSKVEREYPVLNGVLFSILPGRIDDHVEDLRAVSNSFWLKDWQSYNPSDLNSFFNELVMDADGEGLLFSTPRSIRDLMVQMITPKNGMMIMDLFSGVGSTLAALHETYKIYEPRLCGEEINFELYGISTMLCLVNQIDRVCMSQTNVYANKEVSEELYDYILMDAPFAMTATFEAHPVFKYGIPSRSAADWANMQIALHKLSPNGKAITTISFGGLNRTSDVKIRKGIVEEDFIEAVILLPHRLYVNTDIPTALVIFNKQKIKEHKNQILLMDASKHYIRKSRKQNVITEEGLRQIISTLDSWSEVEGFSIIVNSEDLKANDFNLQATIYLNDKIIKQRLGQTIHLKDIAEVLPGVQLLPTDFKALKNNPTHHYLNVKNLQEDRLVYDDEDLIKEKRIDWCGRFDIKAGDLIITTKGTTAKIVMVPEDFKPSFISNNLAIIRVNKEKYSPYVLLKYLTSELGNLVLNNIATGTGIRIINIGKLEALEIPDYGTEKCLEIGEHIKKNHERYQKVVDDARMVFDEEDREIGLKLNL